MDKRFSALALIAVLGIWTAGSGHPAAAQNTQQTQQPASPPQTPPPQPTFRGGINFVRVDVIVSDRQGNAVGDLRQEDFEVTEDGKPQKIESFKLINVSTDAAPRGETPREIRTSLDEESEAARDDVRLFAVFLDDYHVKRPSSMRVHEPLAAFIENQLKPSDMVGVMYPLTPLGDVRLTRDRKNVALAIRQFEGVKYDYTARNQFEQQYAQYPTAVVERIRNDVTMSALKGLVTHLGGLRDGRKAIIFVSEGFSSMLPAQLQDPIASMPGLGNPNQPDPVGGNSPVQDSAAFFANTELQSDLREVYNLANRYNTAIYAVDPRGLAGTEFDLDRNVSLENDRNLLSSTIDTLRMLAEQTDGRAIVNQNDLSNGLRQIVRDTSAYYLLGYSSTQAPSDGKFHDIKVRVKRPSVQVRARRGYWALTADATSRALAPAKPGPPAAVEAALAALNIPPRARPIRTWIGMTPGRNGKTKVTFVWEPAPASPGVRGEVPARVGLIASGDGSAPYFRGKVPDAARAPTSTPAATGAPAASRVEFEVPPGKLEMMLSIEDANAQVIDRDVREVMVSDLSGASVALSTPEVLRARTAREWQMLSADADVVPLIGREFRRAERLLIRFGAYGPGGSVPTVSARLLNRSGQQMSVLSVSQAAVPGRTHQVDVPLANLPVGDYVVELKASGGGGEATEILALRVTG